MKMKKGIFILASSLSLILTSASFGESSVTTIIPPLDEATAKTVNWKTYELIQTAEGLVQGIQAGALPLEQAEKVLQSLEYDSISVDEVRERIKTEVSLSYIHAISLRFIRIIN